MKTTKKLCALLLAMTVLFTVCALSVFASANNTWTTSDFEDSEIDHNIYDGITSEGTFEFDTDGTVKYRLKCIYTKVTDPICTLYAQCAVIYKDGSSDCYSKSMQFVMRPGYDETIEDSFTIPSDNEVESFSLEFQIHENGVMYWEGYLDISCTH